MKGVKVLRRVLYWTIEVITLLGTIEQILEFFAQFIISAKDFVNPDKPK